jgi:hypothetical protein
VNKQSLEQQAELSSWQAQLQALERELSSRAQEATEQRAKLAADRRALEVLQQQVRATPGCCRLVLGPPTPCRLRLP